MKKTLIACGIFFFFPLPYLPSQAFASVLITEIQLQGTQNSQDEFIELYNPNETPYNLENCRLIKKTKSGKSYNLVSKFKSTLIPAHHYFLIASPKKTDPHIKEDLVYSTSHSISNGNLIKLLDPDKNLIDSVGFEGHPEALGKSAPNPSKGKSLERKKDENNLYIQTRDNFEDFFIQSIPTPQNSTALPDQEKKETNEKGNEKCNEENENQNNNTKNTNNSHQNRRWPLILSPTILLNEIYPNPNKNENEWVEIKNHSDRIINLNHCFLKEGSGKKTALNGTLAPYDLYLIQEIKGNLNNNDELLEFFCYEKLLDQLKYGKTKTFPTHAPVPRKGESLIRLNARENKNKSQDLFTISITPTPGKTNIHTPPLKTRKKTTHRETASQNAIPSTDSSLSTSKNIPGRLSQKNNPNQDKTNAPNERTLPIDPPKTSLFPEKKEEKPKKEINKNKETQQQQIEELKKYPTILIHEFLPNPKGSDENEWIELYNPNSQEVNLENWKIDDQEGQSKPYTFKEKKLIPAFGYLVLEKKKIKITLNNQNDEIRLFNPAGQLVSEVSYEDIPEGHSYAFTTSQNWVTSSTLTPGETNKITRKKQEIKKITNNTEITTRGIVSVPPGQLYKRSFFIEPEGYEITIPKKFSLELKQGDLIQITGKKSTVPKRINLKNNTDLTILSHEHAFSAQPISIHEITEQNTSQFLLLEGEVVETKGKKVYLDDNSGEIEIYFQNPPKEKPKPQDRIRIQGILMNKQGLFKLYPRGPKDMLELKKAPTAIDQTEKNLQQKPSKNSKSSFNPPLFISLCANLFMGLKLLKKT